MDFVELELDDGSQVFLSARVLDPEQEVGLADVRIRLADVLSQLRPLVSQVRDRLADLSPSETTLKISVGAGYKSGGVVAVFGGASADLGIELAFTWSTAQTA